MVQFADIQNDQQGLTRDQLAVKAQAATAPAPAATPAPTPAPASFPRIPTPTTDQYSDLETTSKSALLTPPVAPKSQDEIYQDKLKQSQAQIDSINNMFADTLKQEEGNAANRNSQTNALSVARGLTGSPDAGTAADETQKNNDQIRQSIEDQKAAKIAGILSGLQTSAEQEAKDQKAAYEAKAQGNLDAIDKLRAQKAAQVNGAQTQFSQFAQLAGNSTATWEDIKQSQPDIAKQWADATGMDDMQLSLLYNQGKATSQKVTWDDKLSHFDATTGTYVMVGNKPDGSQVIEEHKTSTPIPQEYTPHVVGGKIILTPKTFDPTKPIKDQIVEYGVAKATSPTSPTSKDPKVSTYEVDQSTGKTFKVTKQGDKVISKLEQKTTDAVPKDKIEIAGSNLQKLAGEDGAVAPDVFNEGLQQWVGAGYSAKSYSANFGNFTKSKYSKPSEYNYFPQ